MTFVQTEPALQSMWDVLGLGEAQQRAHTAEVLTKCGAKGCGLQGSRPHQSLGFGVQGEGLWYDPFSARRLGAWCVRASQPRNYQASEPVNSSGLFADIRNRLDADYHGYYTERRQRLQDTVSMRAACFARGSMCPGAAAGHGMPWVSCSHRRMEKKRPSSRHICT